MYYILKMKNKHKGVASPSNTSSLFLHICKTQAHCMNKKILRVTFISYSLVWLNYKIKITSFYYNMFWNFFLLQTV